MLLLLLLLMTMTVLLLIESEFCYNFRLRRRGSSTAMTSSCGQSSLFKLSVVSSSRSSSSTLTTFSKVSQRQRRLSYLVQLQCTSLISSSRHNLSSARLQSLSRRTCIVGMFHRPLQDCRLPVESLTYKVDTIHAAQWHAISIIPMLFVLANIKYKSRHILGINVAKCLPYP